MEITVNRMGWSSLEPHEINLQFARFARTIERPVLDVGAGYGAATFAALDSGATIISNDLEQEHLELISTRVPRSMRDRIYLRRGRFPSELSFPARTLGAIHASNVLHFLTPPELETAVRVMFDWLIPGGRVFVCVNSPYVQNFKDVIQVFERNKKAGMFWPGWVQDLTGFSSHPTLQYLPGALHFFDAEILSRTFERGGFMVEVAEEYSRSGLPEILRYDGRENVMLIARK